MWCTWEGNAKTWMGSAMPWAPCRVLLKCWAGAPCRAGRGDSVLSCSDSIYSTSDFSTSVCWATYHVRRQASDPSPWKERPPLSGHDMNNDCDEGNDRYSSAVHVDRREGMPGVGVGFVQGSRAGTGSFQRFCVPRCPGVTRKERARLSSALPRLGNSVPFPFFYFIPPPQSAIHVLAGSQAHQQAPSCKPHTSRPDPSPSPAFRIWWTLGFGPAHRPASHMSKKRNSVQISTLLRHLPRCRPNAAS